MSIIFSADDFGLTIHVNEAVEQAHVHGVLGQASLMVAAPATADAVDRAKRLLNLNVGLHLVLVDGDSCLGHARLPHITTPDGKFGRNQTALGFQYFFSPAARHELALEIRAQFEAYVATGLPLHHADAHKHMHLHPTVADTMIKIGREFGLTRIRVPAEPTKTLEKCNDTPGIADRALFAWSNVLRTKVRRANLAATDQVFGIKWSGHMSTSRVLQLLQNLPSGSTEIYFHPATERDAALRALMPDYEHVMELKTLLDIYRESPFTS
ncbi:MAG: PTS cellobiose transporter [Rhodospirillales bacterium 20-64-7]|nr:MAG: PTS cellobiose transporter [Rhodospirillales bacterium 20-64-7]